MSSINTNSPSYGRGKRRGPDAKIADAESRSGRLRDTLAPQRFSPTRTVVLKHIASPWELVICEPTTDAAVVYLPDAKLNDGAQIAVKNMTSNNVTVTATSDNTVEAGSTYAINSQYRVTMFSGDALRKTWHVIGQKG